jgi:hypothetical protein
MMWRGIRKLRGSVVKMIHKVNEMVELGYEDRCWRMSLGSAWNRHDAHMDG